MREPMMRMVSMVALAAAVAGMAPSYLAAAGPQSGQGVGDTGPRLEDAVVPHDPPPFGVALYDQTGSPAGAGFASQVFEPGSASFDCRAADDFTVPPADVQWDIGGLQVLGIYVSGGGPTPAINVEFFAAGGVPGGSVCSYPGLAAGVDYTDDGFGNLDITLPLPCSLTAGTYWLSVQADMDFGVGGQWLWGERAVGSNSPFAWENPPNGFGTGCVVWTPAGGCGATAPDLLFALSGVVVPVELQSVTID
jgi:hypothetical protein